MCVADQLDDLADHLDLLFEMFVLIAVKMGMGDAAEIRSRAIGDRRIIPDRRSSKPALRPLHTA